MEEITAKDAKNIPRSMTFLCGILVQIYSLNP
jgi:hypothetical protein